jgi:hypothetical protein
MLTLCINLLVSLSIFMFYYKARDIVMGILWEKCLHFYMSIDSIWICYLFSLPKRFRLGSCVSLVVNLLKRMLKCHLWIPIFIEE